MSNITEIVSSFPALSRTEKFRLAQLLLEDLANEELLATIKEGRVFPIHTPEYAADAATQLARVLAEG